MGVFDAEQLGDDLVRNGRCLNEEPVGFSPVRDRMFIERYGLSMFALRQERNLFRSDKERKRVERAMGAINIASLTGLAEFRI